MVRYCSDRRLASDLTLTVSGLLFCLQPLIGRRYNTKYLSQFKSLQTMLGSGSVRNMIELQGVKKGHRHIESGQ